MERVMEPEVMDGQAQADAYADADFAAPNQAFIERFLKTWPALERGRVIDLGCGPAEIPIRLLLARPGLTVTAVDASAAMLRRAREARDRAGLDARLELLEARLPALDRLTPEGFDAVISNSLLHHLPDPAALWDTARRVARPGAPVLVVDLRRPATIEAAQALVDAHAPDEPPVLRHDFLMSLRAAFTPDEIAAQLRDAGLEDALTVEVISDRHVAVHGRLG